MKKKPTKLSRVFTVLLFSLNAEAPGWFYSTQYYQARVYSKFFEKKMLFMIERTINYQQILELVELDFDWDFINYVPTRFFFVPSLIGLPLFSKQKGTWQNNC